MKTIQFSSFIGLSNMFRTQHGQRVFTDNVPNDFIEGKTVFIFNGEGETVLTAKEDFMVDVLEDEKGQYIEIKYLWEVLQLYPVKETRLKIVD